MSGEILSGWDTEDSVLVVKSAIIRLSIRKGGVKVEPSRVTLEEGTGIISNLYAGNKKRRKNRQTDCLGQILAEPVYAAITSRFQRSAMDGFALRSRDVCGADLEHPVTLEVAGCVCLRDKRQSLYWNHIRQSGS